jgi:hypothetical protein
MTSRCYFTLRIAVPGTLLVLRNKLEFIHGLSLFLVSESGTHGDRSAF